MASGRGRASSGKGGRAAAGSASRERETAFTFRPATPGRWKDVEELFGERGACGGCWCMAWRLPRKDWEKGKGAGNRRRLRSLVRSGRKPGVIAYAGRIPVGWCAVAPREEYGFLERSRVLRPVDEERVWSVSCLFVNRDFRRMGLSSLLLDAAVELAGRAGAKVVEGYPVIPYRHEAPGAFLWTGTTAAFERAGFREVHRWSPARPIMRRRTSGRRHGRC